MAVDGVYNIECTSPRGTQSVKLTLKSEGASLSGQTEGARGTQSSTGGKVSGSDVEWAINLTTPMGEMKQEFKGKVAGDEISGTVQTGSFGSSAFKGKRA